MIQTHQLEKTFGAKVAVNEVGFTAANGVITGLLGPNGAGKTTTLRMIYGLLKPDSGHATIDGHDAHRDARAARRALGVLPDSPGLYGRLTAREHLRYSGKLQGLSGRRLEAATGALIDLFEMDDVLDRRAEGFSQGERRKVALARALIHDPQNVVLDEPTNGLDVMATRAMRRFIRRLAEEGRCVVFSSHIMQEVAALCDRVVILAQGRVAADATPDELLARTGHENLEDAFVDLIGSEEGLQ